MKKYLYSHRHTHSSSEASISLTTKSGASSTLIKKRTSHHITLIEIQEPAPHWQKFQEPASHCSKLQGASITLIEKAEASIPRTKLRSHAASHQERFRSQLTLIETSGTSWGLFRILTSCINKKNTSRIQFYYCAPSFATIIIRKTCHASGANIIL